jgi:hypothetical protein
MSNCLIIVYVYIVFMALVVPSIPLFPSILPGSLISEDRAIDVGLIDDNHDKSIRYYHPDM